MTPELSPLPEGYGAVLRELKERVRSSQAIAVAQVNNALIELYWSIGKTILDQQATESWGSGVVDRLAHDLRLEFPAMKGFSRRNLLYMRAFAAAWPDDSVVQQPVAQLPWGHVTVLLDKLDDQGARHWYASAAAEHGWSRNVLLNQIMNRTRERIGAAPSNFSTSLQRADSELAQQIAKDPYVLDFLDLSADVAERDLEQALIDRLVDTLKEFGPGFAFVGRQVHFEVDGDDYYVDLLFFHVQQLRYVVVELKVGKFEPEFAGKLGFYVALVDAQLRTKSHAPTVGLLLCADRNESVVRLALANTQKPVAVSTYTYETLPPEAKKLLPSAESINDALQVAGAAFFAGGGMPSAGGESDVPIR
jgi:predicted nuclease of restriction endonuclease-like (RecB) superfamily